jgi:hypothetical protein
MTMFGTLNKDGTLSNVRHIKQTDMLKCPHTIMVAEHYREDGTCRCDDEANAVMAEWGYEWRDGGWR